MLCTMYLCDAANMYKYTDYTHAHGTPLADCTADPFFMEKTTF